MDIGSLTGEISLEDQVSDKLTQISNRVKNFAEHFDGAMGAVAISVGVAAAAVVGMAVSIEQLGKKGSTLNDVENAFDRLAESAGSTGEELRGALSRGVKSTVDEMTLMQTTSRLLSSGMKLNAADAQTMGEAGRAMGKAMGTDATRGLNTLSMALTTGQTRLLRRAGILVDLKKAEEQFASSIGATRDQLSDEGILEARRIGILEAARSQVEKLGVSELSFKEKLMQATVAVEEWEASLAKQVASSPHVMAMLDALEKAFKQTFGGDGQTAIQIIMGWVNRFADAVAYYGPKIITTLGGIKDGILTVWRTVQGAWDTVPDWFKNIAEKATLAGGAIYLTQKSITGLMGAADLGTLANVAQIWSVLEKHVLSGAAALATGYKAIAALSTYSGWEALTISIDVLIIKLKALTVAWATSPMGVIALTGAAIYGVWKASGVVQEQYEAMVGPKSKSYNAYVGLPKMPAARSMIGGLGLPAIPEAGISHGYGGGASIVDEEFTKRKTDLDTLSAKIKWLAADEAKLTNISLGYISAQKEMGKTEADIALQLNVHAESLSQVTKRMQDYATFTDQVTKMNDELEASHRSDVMSGEALTNANIAAAKAQATRDEYVKFSRGQSAAKTEVELKELIADIDAKYDRQRFEAERAVSNQLQAVEMNRNADNIVSFNDYWLKRQEQNLTGTAKELFDIQRSRDTALDAFGERTEANAAMWDSIWAYYEEDVQRIQLTGIAKVEDYYAGIDRGIASMKDQTKDASISLQGMADMFVQLGQVAGDSLSGILSQIGQVTVILNAAQRASLYTTNSEGEPVKRKKTGDWGLATDLFSKNATSAQRWASAVSTASTVASGAMEAFTSKSFMGSVAGGAKAGSAFGPWGAAIGAGIGAAVGGLKKLFGGASEAEKAARTSNRQFEEMVGGHGMAFAENVRAAYGKVHLSAVEANRDVERMWKAEKQGAEAVKAIQEEIAKKIALRGLLDSAMMQLSSYTDKYHFTANQASADLYKAYTLMVNAGLGPADVLKRMGPDLKKLVVDAAKWGTALPEKMRSIIEQMLAAGKISQETFNKLTFSSDALTSPFDQITESVMTLVAAIKYDLGLAISDAERKLLGLASLGPIFTNKPGSPLPTSTPGPMPGGPPAGAGPGYWQIVNGQWEWIENAPAVTPSYSGGAAPSYYGTGGAVPSAANAPPTMSTPDGEYRAGRPGQSSGGTVIIEIDGRELAAMVVPELEGELVRYGLRAA